MAAHFFDIDGTLVKYHTNDWLSGAKEYLIKLFRDGHQIYLITRRGGHDHGKEWSIEKIHQTILKDLEKVGVNFQIIFNVKCPRHLHDDHDCFAHRRITDQSWE